MNRSSQAGFRPGSLFVVLLLAFCAVVAGRPLLGGLGSVNRSLVDSKLSQEEASKALVGLNSGEVAALAEREKQRLLAEPLDLRAISNLAVLRGLAGDKEAAKAYSLESTTRSLRDPAAQLIAADSFLQTQDYGRAFKHLDALLATQPSSDDKLFPVIAAQLDNSDAVAELAKVLKRVPLWKEAFTAWLAQNDATGERAFALFSAVRNNGGIVTDTENRLLVTKQIQQQAYDKAYFFWLDSLGPDQLSKVGRVFDGQFTLEPKNQFFDWTLANTANVTAAVRQQSDGKGSELLVSFLNSEKPVGEVAQFLHLEPGNYQMKGEWQSTHLDSPAGLQWTVTCLGGGGFAGKSKAFASAGPPSTFMFAVVIPQQGCEFQILRLTNASDAVLDQKITGELVFRDLSIDVVQ